MYLPYEGNDSIISYISYPYTWYLVYLRWSLERSTAAAGSTAACFFPVPYVVLLNSYTHTPETFAQCKVFRVVYDMGVRCVV